MSTYGTAFVVDVAADPSFEPPPLIRANLVSGFRTTADDGWSRVVALVSEVDVVDELLVAVASLGRGRIAIAEDNDEFGAQWVVARGGGGAVDIVQRRYVLNADPADADAVEAAIADLDRDPRATDVAGLDAADAAAELFAVPPGPVRDAEHGSASAWEEIGIVGGPFPWWDALQLPWPEPPAGAALDW